MADAPEAPEPMVSMKRPAKAQKAMSTAEFKPPEYGYGLSIRLENFELDALKIRRLPQVGDVFDLEAKVVVDSVHESQSTGNQGDRCVTLQITDLYLGPPDAD